MKELKAQRPMPSSIRSFSLMSNGSLDFEHVIDPNLDLSPISPNSIPPRSSRSSLGGPWQANDHEVLPPSATLDVDRIACGIDTLPLQVLRELVDTWFSDYYRWIPILHRPSLLDTLQTSASLPDTSVYIIFKAIMAVAATTSKKTESFQIPAEDRQRLALSFRCQVVMEAMGSLSLQSLQALLIIAILDYGAGKLSDFWNLVALGKR